MFWIKYNSVYIYFYKFLSSTMRFIIFNDKSTLETINNRIRNFFLNSLEDLDNLKLKYLIGCILVIKNLMFYFNDFFSKHYIFLRAWRVLYVFYLTNKKENIKNDFHVWLPFKIKGRIRYLFVNESWNGNLRMELGAKLLSKRYSFFRAGRKYSEFKKPYRINSRFGCTIRVVRNNIFFTFYSRDNGSTILSVSAGRVRFTGKKKRSPFAANKVALFFAKKVMRYLNKFRVESLYPIKVLMRVTTWGMTSAIIKQSFYGLKEGGLLISRIVDDYRAPHAYPVRRRKPRRV